MAEIEAQTSDIGENRLNLDLDNPESEDLRAVEDRISILCKPGLLDPWMKYLKLFSTCRVQRSHIPIGLPQASRLLQLIAAFGCPKHFITMKRAIAQYRVLMPAKNLEKPLDLLHHLYKLGVWTESVGLINIILQHLARFYFTSLINEGSNLFINMSSKNNAPKKHAVTQAIKAFVVKIDPRLEGLDSSDNVTERSAFWEMQHNLQR